MLPTELATQEHCSKPRTFKNTGFTGVYYQHFTIPVTLPTRLSESSGDEPRNEEKMTPRGNGKVRGVDKIRGLTYDVGLLTYIPQYRTVFLKLVATGI